MRSGEQNGGVLLHGSMPSCVIKARDKAEDRVLLAITCDGARGALRVRSFLIDGPTDQLDQTRDTRCLPAGPLSLVPVTRNWRGVIPLQRLKALVKELTSRYPNSHAISETGRSRSAR